MNNFVMIVLDGVGIGELPDANQYHDEGSNTLVNIANAVGGLNLPALQKFGLGNIHPIPGIPPAVVPLASYGKMKEISCGKDSTTGHWELGGINVQVDFPYYPDGFPEDIVKKFIELSGVNGILGNKTASGTEIINELGDKHITSGFPIIYTSADSVFQIAAHEEIIPVDELYDICKIAREKIFVNRHSVGRVIARPFVGKNGNFTRTLNRKDFSMDPVAETVLDLLYYNKIQTIAVGKISDLFNNRGIKIQMHTKSNGEGVDRIVSSLKNENGSFIFANLVDFDVYYGHRNNAPGFYTCLQEFDHRLDSIVNQLDKTDAMIITADHGNDPTDISTDHTREYVPLLFYRKNKSGLNLGIRETFSDAAKTAADYFQIANSLKGKSFLK